MAAYYDDPWKQHLYALYHDNVACYDPFTQLGRVLNRNQPVANTRLRGHTTTSICTANWKAFKQCKPLPSVTMRQQFSHTGLSHSGFPTAIPAMVVFPSVVNSTAYM